MKVFAPDALYVRALLGAAHARPAAELRTALQRFLLLLGAGEFSVGTAIHIPSPVSF